MTRMRIYALPAGLAAATAALRLPTLARWPQNPDGAEMVAIAESGKGILHPPYFPLQSWLGDAFTALPWSTPAWRLALLSWLCQAVQTFFMARLLQRFAPAPAVIAFSSLAFAFFPTTWAMGAQAEKYSLWILLLTLFAYCARGRASAGWLTGALWGAALTQQPLSVAFLPLLPRFTLSFGLSALVTAFALYASLLLRIPDSVWPHWGAIASFSDLWTRLGETPVWTQLVQPGGTRPAVHNAAAIFWTQLWSSFGILSLAPLLCWSWLKKENRGTAICQEFLRWLAAFVAINVLLWFLRLRSPSAVSWTYLERYGMGALLPFTILLALAGQTVADRITPRTRKPMIAFVAATCLLWAWGGWQSSDLSRSRSLELYSRFLGIGLDEAALFVSGEDLDSFGGARLALGRRYPLLRGHDWAERTTNAKLDPRLAGTQPLPKPEELARNFYQRGIPVASTDIGFIARLTRTPEARGLLWVAQPGGTAVFTARTASAAREACTILESADGPLAPDASRYARYLQERLRQPFFGAIEYHRSRGETRAQQAALQVSLALLEGQNPSLWIQGCRQYRESL